MLSRIRQSKKEQGFTIIEVLIVLAIAGLILLVVFLAVPALQRNARNTQRTEDAGNILSSVSEFTGNNNGQVPAGKSGTGTALVMGGAGTNTIPVNLGYYDAGSVTVSTYVAAGSPTTNTTTTDTIQVLTGAICNTASIGTATGGSTRATVILYTLETTSKQCRQS